MKQILLSFAVVALVGCGKPAVTRDEVEAKASTEVKSSEEEEKPLTKKESAKVIEAAIRKERGKPTGELTKADYEWVTKLYLDRSQLTDVKGPEKLTQLRHLELRLNPDLTKAQIAELQKALPKCKIYSDHD